VRRVGTVTFTGFAEEALAFYAGLEADNSKAYWADHKAVYERAVRGPLAALLDELADEFGTAKLFRPHRDVRFSADKSPYKTQQGAVVAGPGGVGAWYVRIDATGLMAGGGFLGLEKEQLARFRAAVDADRTGAPLAAAVERLRAAGFVAGGEALVRVPRGFDAEHARGDLLRHKGMTLTRDHEDPDWLFTSECAEHVRADWRALTPVLEWLGAHVA